MSKADALQNELYQGGLIITDDIAIEPILDFNLYSNAIVNIVRNSYPKFTIGLFGDWGTGKTTLMNSIRKELEKDKENTITIWFDAWKYENEKQFALIPLLKTINYSIKDEKDQKKKNLKEALGEAAIFTLGISNEILSAIVTNYAGKELGGLFKKSLDDVASKLIPQLRNLKKLSEADRNSIFYLGLDNIQEALNAIRKDTPNFRLVIFIDDLDRCSPSKTLEVLESMKIFLSLDGIIYILGLSHDIVTKLIDLEYKETGVKGEQYIKKMIQIPITLPRWNNKDITELIRDFKDKKLIHEKYKDLIDEDLISATVENNPRELKRFLNNFIIAYEIFSPSENFNARELLFTQAIQLRWNQFYNLLIVSDDKFREELKKYIQMDEDTRSKTVDSVEVEQSDDKNQVLRIRKQLSSYKTDSELWNFLMRNSEILNSIKDWTIYRRAVEVGIEPVTRLPALYEEAYALLRDGKIYEFNKRKEFHGADLSGADLSGANLRGADLRLTTLLKANLNEANLNEANLRGANLRGAKLHMATLLKANLGNADLLEADFRGADLNEANLRGANLRGADLSGTDLSGADLRGSNLTLSIIISPRYVEKVIVDTKTDFKDAIIDDANFIDMISGSATNIPGKIENKKELNMRLSKRVPKIDTESSDIIVSSTLPD